MQWCKVLDSFPGLQSPNTVEGLVKLLHRMTSGGRLEVWLTCRACTSTTVHQKCHASKRPPDVILRRSFTRPSTALAVIKGLGTRLTECSLLVIYMVSRSHVILMKILRLKCLQLPVLNVDAEQVSTFPSTSPPIKTAER